MEYRINIYSKIVIMLMLFILPFEFIRAETIYFTEGEYTEAYKKWLALPENERNSLPQPSKYLTSKNFFVASPAGAGSVSLGSVSASEFDLRSVNGKSYVTPARGQGDTSDCWAFASLASVESNAIVKNGSISGHLSPAHLELATQNTLSQYTLVPFNREFKSLEGADKNSQSAAYFANRVGPVYESDVPFSNIYGQVTISSSEFKSKKPVFIVDDFVRYDGNSGKCSAETIGAIKSYLVTNGAILASVTHPDSSRKYLYNSTNTTIDHNVTIIGWDDTVSGSLFSPNASRNGAWIVKNSVGTTSGDFLVNNNIYYISYDDILVCSSLAGFYNVVPATSEKLSYHKYIYDELYVDTILGFGNYALSLANRFTKTSNNNERLKEITVASELANQQYEIYVSTTGQFADLVKVKSGTFDHIGYTTINIDENVIITDDFVVAVKYYPVNGDNRIPVYVQGGNNTYYTSEVESNKSFVASQGCDLINNANSCMWGDTGNYYVSIRAFTVDTTEEPTQNPDPGTDPEPTTKTFTVNFRSTTGIKSISESSLSCQTTTNSCTITLPTVTVQSGYSFAGWFSDSNLNNNVSSSQGGRYVVTKNTTLYAGAKKEDAAVDNYIATLINANNKIENKLSCTPTNGSCTITLPSYSVSSGYKFLGWHLYGDSTLYNAGSKFTLKGNTVLYAKIDADESGDPNVTDNINIVIKENENNKIDIPSTEEDKGENPDTGSFKSTIMILFILILIGGCGYYSYNYFRYGKEN